MPSPIVRRTLNTLTTAAPTPHLRRKALPRTGVAVSIVVPAYNEEQLLPRSLAALKAQDYDGPIEIIVVNNASTDRTAEVAEAEGVTVVFEAQRDYCHALICGFREARGEIIALTDADSVAPPNWISTLVATYQQQPDVVAVGGNVVFDKPNWKGWLLAKVLVPSFNWLDRHDPRGPHLWGSNFSVRRDAFDAIGGWNSNYSLEVDSEISERLREIGRVVVLGGLKMRTSSRRWNTALLHNLFLYVSNFIWMKLLARPLWRDFPVIRDEDPPRKRHRVRVAVMAALAVAALTGLGEGAFGPKGNLFGKTYYHGDRHEKVVALTFDDGPNDPCTSRVLDILRQEHVHATFFLIGENVRAYPATAARIVREGHVVGNHSDHHKVPLFAFEPAKELRAEVNTAEETIHEATGQNARFFRPPQGLRSPTLMKVLQSDSLTAVTWDDAAGDWDPMAPATIVKRTVMGARPGSIILLHDGMNTLHGADQDQTVQALPQIIEQLRARGFRFVTLPELLHCPSTLSSWPPVHATAEPRVARAVPSHSRHV